MAEGNPDKILEDLEDYRRSGDLERLQSEIVSDMDIESVDDNHATVKHAWLGFATDREGIDRLTCELATWEMRWDEEVETWMVDEWATVETLFQVDILKDRIPWKKIRGLIFKTDKECANVIAESPLFENAFIAATAQLPTDEDDIYSLVADPLLRKALTPGDELDS